MMSGQPANPLHVKAKPSGTDSYPVGQHSCCGMTENAAHAPCSALMHRSDEGLAAGIRALHSAWVVWPQTWARLEDVRCRRMQAHATTTGRSRARNSHDGQVDVMCWEAAEPCLARRSC